MNDKKVLKQILKQLDPRTIRSENDVFNYFLKSGIYSTNFVGGSGSARTKHEKLFSLIYPNLKQQVSFGTGKSGLEKYLSKIYTVDFFDEENMIAYEIDGKNHDTELQMAKDKVKSLFLWLELGIKTIRIKNEEVENMALKIIEMNSGDHYE